MLVDAMTAALEILTPPFRRVLVQSWGLTLLLMGGAWFGLQQALGLLLRYAAPWVQTVASVATGLGLVVALAFVIAPVAFLVAGFFFDRLAAQVEAKIDAPQGVGRTPRLGVALKVAIGFAGVALAANLVALMLLAMPGINAFAFLGANAYLFGRGYFELAALRYAPEATAAALRRRHGLEVFSAGLLVALVATVPLLNLLTPLFGTALLVRLHARILARERRQTSR